MQLMIDILAETPAALRLAATFLNDHAALRDAMEGAGQTARASVPAGTFQDNGTANVYTPPAAPEAPPAPLDIPPPPPPANVLPFVPPAPVAPMTSPSLTPTAPITAPAAVAATVPAVSGAPLTAAANPVAPVADEYDSSGVPFDARIHQKKRGKKKDGTWKLQKGIDDAIVAGVMKELAPRVRHPGAASLPTQEAVAAAAQVPPASLFGQTPLPAGASTAPVSLPATGALPLPPVPPAPTNPAAVVPAQNVAGSVPVPPPPAPGAIPAPPPPAVEQPTVDPFRALVNKITQARKDGKMSAEEVTQCVVSAGAPSLQLLNAMPQLIPTVEASIDAILALR